MFDIQKELKMTGVFTILLTSGLHRENKGVTLLAKDEDLNSNIDVLSLVQIICSIRDQLSK